MTRWAVRFAYDGRAYYGWARQPGRPTVEGTIRVGLVRCGIASTPEEARLEVASRTDRGVSARGNVLALSSALPGSTLLRALNSIAPDLNFQRASPVPETFRPRHALFRWYRYFEPSDGRVLSTWKAAARRFEGPVDTRTFGRGLAQKTPTMRRLDRVEVRRSRELLVIDLRGSGFVWGMVRKIVGAIREVDHGRLSMADLEAAIRGERRLTLPLAQPERLVLWEVRVPVRWRYRWTSPTRAQRRTREEAWEDLATSRALVRALYPRQTKLGRRPDGERER